MVERAEMLLRGMDLYPDASRGGPYLFTAYPPLFFAAQAVLMKLFGGLWWPGRFLAFAGYLGCGLLLCAWGWKRWGKPWALALTFLFWLSPTWARWGSIARPDTTALFLNFISFLILYRLSEGDARERTREPLSLLALAGFLSGASVLFKQTALTLTAAYALSSFWERRWKDFQRFVFPGLLFPLGVYGYETWKTHGLFLKYTGSWLDTGFDARLLGQLFSGFLGEVGWLVVALALGICGVRPLAVCQILLSSLQLLGLGRSGGAENYWLEFWLYGFFLLGEGLRRESRPSASSGLGEWGKGKWALFLLLLWGYLTLLGKEWPGLPSRDVIALKMEVSKIYEEPGEHLALDLDLPVMAGRRIWVQPVEYGYMVQKGRWNLQPLLSEIQEGKFKTIELYDIPRQYLLPQPVVDEIERDYRVVLRVSGRKWYRRR